MDELMAGALTLAACLATVTITRSKKARRIHGGALVTLRTSDNQTRAVESGTSRALAEGATMDVADGIPIPFSSNAVDVYSGISAHQYFGEAAQLADYLDDDDRLKQMGARLLRNQAFGSFVISNGQPCDHYKRIVLRLIRDEIMPHFARPSIESYRSVFEGFARHWHCGSAADAKEFTTKLLEDHLSRPKDIYSPSDVDEVDEVCDYESAFHGINNPFRHQRNGLMFEGCTLVISDDTLKYLPGMAGDDHISERLQFDPSMKVDSVTVKSFNRENDLRLPQSVECLFINGTPGFLRVLQNAPTSVKYLDVILSGFDFRTLPRREARTILARFGNLLALSIQTLPQYGEPRTEGLQVCNAIIQATRFLPNLTHLALLPDKETYIPSLWNEGSAHEYVHAAFDLVRNHCRNISHYVIGRAKSSNGAYVVSQLTVEKFLSHAPLIRFQNARRGLDAHDNQLHLVDETSGAPLHLVENVMNGDDVLQ
jgi:hypothetical protein